MRYSLVAAAVVLCGLVSSGAGTAMQTRSPHAGPTAHRLASGQAMQLVRLVASYDHIDLSDSHVEVNSLDLMSPFIPGYASFILIREAMTPGPDTTLGRYAVNRRTGDVWEITLCRRYDFPALQRMQRALTGHVATPSDAAAERQELGCSAPKSGNPQTNPLYRERSAGLSQAVAPAEPICRIDRQA